VGDDASRGELLVRFSLEGELVRVGQVLTYELKEGGGFNRLADFLFIKREMQRSLGRSLGRLRLELDERVRPVQG
jgi:hypothetical protein